MATNAAQLESATKGFDHLFSNEITQAMETFATDDSAFHLLGQGVCAFLEAALGMESAKMSEASRFLSLAEAASKKQAKSAKTQNNHRFPPGTDMEILNADSVILLGITNALSESYMGYLQCMYALNNGHSKFTKLYNTVFPNGLEGYRTPAATPPASRKSSNPSLRSTAQAQKSNSFFGRWANGSSLTVPQTSEVIIPDGPIEEMIVAGTAFGYGLFNLVFSLLPKRIQSVVGFFGFKHDRKLALQALAVSAAKKDVHSVFAGLVLMTYRGIVLLLSGWQADEAHILKQYRAIVDDVDTRYPTGSLWILNRAKILRMSHDSAGAIQVLQDGLKAERKIYAQADTLLVFELAWTLLGDRRYEEAAEMFMRMTELNNWSHPTYFFIAAGCFVSVGNVGKAQELLDRIEAMENIPKVGGKDLPTEVLIKKKLVFYKEKQRRRGGDPAKYAESIKISPAEELGVFWNTHSRISTTVAEEHIKEWSALTPEELDTPDELALRSLLLGIVYRTVGNYTKSKELLDQAYVLQPKIVVSTWIGGVSAFERAVLDLKTASSEEGTVNWTTVLKEASEWLDKAAALAPNSVDLSSRLDSRITMLRDEIEIKREMVLGLQV